ncbi:unnamed protein product [Anisakis simplex]|uniref:Uncharacterized protein n=1 Tax=Anisakis simplex TaxID=6269 RepID=A0A0M3IYE6_ANISI|nr:unnamed protein product [Anisakis simplex]
MTFGFGGAHEAISDQIAFISIDHSTNGQSELNPIADRCSLIVVLIEAVAFTTLIFQLSRKDKRKATGCRKYTFLKAKDLRLSTLIPLPGCDSSQIAYVLFQRDSFFNNTYKMLDSLGCLTLHNFDQLQYRHFRMIGYDVNDEIELPRFRNEQIFANIIAMNIDDEDDGSIGCDKLLGHNRCS